MGLSPDELAGVVDLFGALTRPQLREACVELAHKAGADADPEDFDPDIDGAVAGYQLVAVPDGDAESLVVGPTAFPELPDGATDLPHILDAEERSVDRQRVASAAERQFRDDAASAVEAGDSEAIEHLLDVSYELDVWGPVELSETRERLDSALEGSG